MNIFDALSSEKIKVDIGMSEGKTAAEYVYVYPPDIPLIVPGEIITRDIIDTIINYKNKGLNIISDSKRPEESIYVVKEK